MTKFEKNDAVFRALDSFQLELPSWGFANTGTRFGKFLQPAAASSIDEKFADAAEVHRFTGAAPTLALHVLWDLPDGLSNVAKIQELSGQHGIRIGAINPNLFQNQEYKYGSLGNPDRDVRQLALDHIRESIEIARALGSKDISLWLADGSNYPGTQNIRKRIALVQEGLCESHALLREGQRLLIEYKPFEPAFYHTDIADWGMALLLAKGAGPRSQVLVDLGHHYPSQNIEQIVAWLLHQKMMGGFHFNDRRYADDDLTLGSIDPYQVFRIFYEIRMHSSETGKESSMAYMVDQSHNLKGKIEAMIQTVCVAQELCAKACLIDLDQLYDLQEKCALVAAEECLRNAFWADVRPLLVEWRRRRGLPADPLSAFRGSGYLERITRDRGVRKSSTQSSYA